MRDRYYGTTIDRLREGTEAYTRFGEKVSPLPPPDLPPEEEPSIWEKIFQPFSAKVQAWQQRQMPIVSARVTMPEQKRGLEATTEQWMREIVGRDLTQKPPTTMNVPYTATPTKVIPPEEYPVREKSALEEFLHPTPGRLGETPGEQFAGEWILPAAVFTLMPGLTATAGWKALAPWIAAGGAKKLVAIGGRVLLSPLYGAEKAIELPIKAGSEVFKRLISKGVQTKTAEIMPEAVKAGEAVPKAGVKPTTKPYTEEQLNTFREVQRKQAQQMAEAGTPTSEIAKELKVKEDYVRDLLAKPTTPIPEAKPFIDIPNYELIDKYLGDKAHVEYTAAIIGGEKSFAPIAKIMDNDIAFKTALRQTLKDMGLPDEITVYRGVKRGVVSGEYTNVSLDSKIASRFGDVHTYKTKLEDVVGIGKPNESELIFRTKSLTEAKPTTTPSAAIEGQGVEAIGVKGGVVKEPWAVKYYDELPLKEKESLAARADKVTAEQIRQLPEYKKLSVESKEWERTHPGLSASPASKKQIELYEARYEDNLKAEVLKDYPELTTTPVSGVGGAIPPAKPPEIPPSGIVAAVEGTKPSGKYFLPEPPRVPTDYMAFARKEVAGSFKGKVGALDTVEQARQQVLKARETGQNTVPYVMSYIRQAGDITKEFGIDSLGMANKVANPEGLSLAINDVLSNYTHYGLNPVQREIAKRQGFVYQEALKLAKSYGVKISELGGPDEFWQYIARRVKSKYNPVTNTYETPKPITGGFRMGAKISAQKERIFDEMMEGVDLGFLYEHPNEVMAQHIKGIYRLIGNKQAEIMVKPLTRAITKQAPLQFGERAIGEPAMRARAANKEIADAIDKIFTPEQSNKWLDFFSKMSRAAVGQVAALDFSPLNIQGVTVLGHDLKMGLQGKPSFIWLKSWGTMAKTFKTPDRITKFRIDNQPLYKRAIEAGVSTSESEFVSGVNVVQRGLGKIPVAGKSLEWAYRQSYGRMGSVYSGVLEEARIKLFGQLEPIWQKSGYDMFALGTLANKMTGTISAAARGVGAIRRQIESIFAFAPNYIRVSLLLLKDLISRGATAREVQASIATLLTVGASVYYVEEKMRGLEPKMRPWPKKFGGDGAEAFTTLIGNTRVGIGSWMYGMIKTLAEVAAVAVDDASALVVWNAQHPIIRYLKSKAGALPSLVGELASGRNFYGKPFDSPDDYLMRIVEALVPISAQSMIAQEPKGEAAQVVTELLGLRAFPYTLKSRWTDEGAFKEYDDIPTSVLEVKERGIPSRDQYRKDNPVVDAKLFITGQVSSIQSDEADSIVKKILEVEKIDPMTINVVKKWSPEVNARRLKQGLKDTLTDRLIKDLRKGK